MPNTAELSCRIIRVVYEVSREVGLTESLAIGPAMRVLEVGELLEAAPAEGVWNV